MVDGDVIECGYHGLRFDQNGKCIFNPRAEGRINDRLSVKSYALMERYGLIWIWGGNAEEADPSLLPILDRLNAANKFAVTEGYIPSKTHYQLVIDNLLDASHADYLHPQLLNTNGAFGRQTPKVEQGERCITETFWFEKQPAVPLVDRLLPRPGELVDQQNIFRWHAPSVVEIIGSIYPEGVEPLEICGVHVLTPGRHNETHYWWRSVRNCGPMTADVQQAIQVATTEAFVEQDKPMLEGVQDMMDGRDFWEMQPAILEGDAAAILVRRQIKKRIAAETVRA